MPFCTVSHYIYDITLFSTAVYLAFPYYALPCCNTYENIPYCTILYCTIFSLIHYIILYSTLVLPSSSLEAPPGRNSLDSSRAGSRAGSRAQSPARRGRGAAAADPASRSLEEEGGIISGLTTCFPLGCTTIRNYCIVLYHRIILEYDRLQYAIHGA